MLRHFLAFEIRYWLRGWMLWIFLLVVSAMIFGAVSSDQITVGGSLENTYRNAPFVIENFYSILCLLALLMTTAFVNSAATRDFAHNTQQIVFTTPISKSDYLGGRFLGAALVSVIPLLGVSIGILLAKYMPWADAERWGPIYWSAHLNGILVFAIPNTLLIAAVIFAIAVLSRSTVAAFIGALVLLTSYGVAAAFMTDLKNETLAALLDPFAIRTFGLATKYWTVAEKNNLSIGFSGLLLWNRLIWLAVAGLVFAFTWARFRFDERSRRRKTPKLEEDVPVSVVTEVRAVPAYGWRAQLAQFTGSTWTEFKLLVRTTSFIVITIAALLNCVPNIIFNQSEGYGNTFLPVTYRIIEVINGTLYLFLIAMITYYAGVLVWKERDAGADEISDALPHRDWPIYASKFAALLGSLFLIQCVVMLAGILTQVWEGYHRYQLGLYVSELLLMDFSFFIFLAALAFFLHVLSPNKYIGYFAFIVFLIANFFVWRPLNVATRLAQFAMRPDYTYSDFYGHAPYLPAWLWFTFYWGLFCALLAASTLLFWPRGRDSRWQARMANARARFTAPMRTAVTVLLICFTATGGWILYNTKILNVLRSETDGERLTADYEKTYKQYQHLPQPRITAVKYAIDIYPEKREAFMRGEQTVVNRTGAPIGELHVTLTRDMDTSIEMPGAHLVRNDLRLGYQIYRLSPPLNPGESRTMKFSVGRKMRGFESSLSMPEVMPNGTFFNNRIAPQIAYQPGIELERKDRRKKYGLKEKDPMPPLERNCTAHCGDTYLSNNSDWVSVETIISTSPDQIAIAPGSLVKEWTENGRHYYQYRLDHDALNFYSFLSADYQVQREQWKDISLEVYYLKEHPWNVQKMVRSMKKSLDYFTTNFGPYANKQARIIEFPRVARFAQAFPGTMPYSESIGFIANLKDPDDIDHVFYIVAHEMAHQWWAHQLVGANMQGATLLSETMAQYSALMVMEKEYGRDTMRRFLQYEMDNYLRSRGREMLAERPLEKVESDQGYIHYRKGSVAMYYLREMIGEEAVNRALRKVLAKYGYQGAPYATSYDLVDAFREETPPELQYLIQDLFEDITLFSNRALSASAMKRADGKYDVTVEVESRKFKADSKGQEKEVPVQDWIEIGAFAAPEKGKKFGKLLHRERVHMTGGKSTYHFTVDQLPDKAGIDPLLLLVDRVPDDNLKNVTPQGS